MFTLDNLVIGKENYTDAVRLEILSDIEGELAKAEEEQIKLMEAEKRVSGGVRKNLPFGRLRFKVCQEVYHFWGLKLGYECWKDNTFKNDMERRWGELITIKSQTDKVVA
jgi:predicted nucleotidyltransferase